MKSSIKGSCLLERKKRETRKLLKCVILPVLFALKHFDVHNKGYCQKNFSSPCIERTGGIIFKTKKLN